MHGQVRAHLEEVLSGREGSPTGHAADHLAECRECSDEVKAMRSQAALLHSWQAPEEKDPRPGFYARVMERIEAEGAASIWSLFFDSAFGKRLAFASLALAALLCIVLISSERFSASDSQVAVQAAPFGDQLQGQVVMGEDQPGVVLTGAPDDDSVLVNLVTYREQ